MKTNSLILYAALISLVAYVPTAIANTTEESIKERYAQKVVTDRIVIKAPTIAENGAQVPITIDRYQWIVLMYMSLISGYSVTHVKTPLHTFN